ncbi:indole-3-glycerol phosphate synthase [Candidatus Roizmanbacteria bacterium CG06_land_8_20_14_3_00_34_14]|uniref:indole-3-glycerol-phosphate synthase n=2 Tax=Candidatus Roizmaniibacteriota TaxID=1752723 RepID=A0A2M7ATJ8_9BACT|nr:MAG: indole-3-glycerol phosphate synthase [Candidatus Roizmanbacteria bacterium CG07_land_8_20_14_0_80_34_15]PIU73951.1 MAG: indole-3-glycerol phosphate synthase [Candidatus Roizmanbacteria bacterium CG06_land_8_20_14_3_00_34_14]
MHKILKQIVEKKQEYLNGLKRGRFLNLPENKMAIIAEIKMASPTVPYFESEKNIVKRAVDYKQAGVDAISIITEKHFFKGSPKFIPRIKKSVDLPVLQKDFVIDSYQIYEAKIIGANALLLITKITDKQTLIKFVLLCQEIGIEPIVEISDEIDLKKALQTSTKIIAVNARNLETFDVNVDQACRLMEKIPDRFVKLGFSGIKSSNEVKKYQRAGAKGILVGTSLMKTNNIKSFIRELQNYESQSKNLRN